jgi:site-specific DNA-methyltransferase (adenine-specific)
MKVATQLEEAERVERLHDAGQITLTSDLRNTDAVSFLSSLSESSIDLFLTDPPFGMTELEDRRGEDSKNGSQSYTSHLAEHDNSTPEKVLAMLELLAPQMLRTLKPGSHFYMFCEVELLGEIKNILTKSGLIIQWPLLIWDKQRSTNPFRGYNYLSCYESIIYGYKPPEPGKDPRRLADSSSAILRYSAIHASKKIHVFEKPIELLADLIKRSTNYGDVVADPFAGSAATLIAALQTGRKALGSEINKDHWLKAQGRLLMEASEAKDKVKEKENGKGTAGKK